MSTGITALEQIQAGSSICYHCGLPVPVGTRFSVVVGGERRPMCCAGCEAVAGAIVGAGLESYYAKRDAFPDSPREALPGALRDLKVFDRPEVQSGFVTEPAEHEREAALIIEGITCPACVWLNETHLRQQPGVIAAGINYTTHRARVRWDARRTTLSEVLSAIRAIGYRAHPYDAGALEASQKRESRGLLARLAVAGLGMMQVMMYAIPAYVAEAGTMTADLEALMRWASLVLTTPVVFYSSSLFFSAAWRDLRARRPGMDVPVALAITAAFAASVWATLSGSGEVYFDSLTMFVFLLLGARYLELRARQKAAMHLEALSRAAPSMANRLLNFPLCLNTETVTAGSLAPGDLILVRPGEAFPADGRIEQGQTEADESLLTGESRPVPREEGQPVIAGSVNCLQPVVVEVEKVGAQTILSSIVHLTERAAHTRPRLQEITDRVAARFTAAVLLIATAAGIYWLARDAQLALPIVIAVLVVTCPCALALATPMALAVAASEASRRGLLVTRGHALETLARAECFVLDKTGTVTEGRPVLREVKVLRGTREAALATAKALESVSEHPFGGAIRNAAGDSLAAEDARNFPGRGVEGLVGGRRVRIGNADFVAQLCEGTIRGTFGGVWLGDEGGPIAAFTFSDAVRAGAEAAVQQLRALGERIVLLSGDSEMAVREVAEKLGIEEWKAAMSPHDKLQYVKALQQRGATVAMVGDGVNDAPVLAQAQVSIAMPSGAALAQGTADMMLLSGRLLDLAGGLRHARRTLRIIRQNLGWALAYNAVAIPLAVAGFVTPWLAGIGMAGSSMLVVMNALRLARDGKGVRREGVKGEG